MLNLEHSRQAVEVAELHADGLLSDEQLWEFWHTVWQDADVLVICSSEEDAAKADDPSRAFARAVAHAASPEGASYDRERFEAWAAAHSLVKKTKGNVPWRAFGKVQCDFLRDLFSPFRPLTIDPAWLAWDAGCIARLAQAAYQERHLPSGYLDNARLGILADALVDAGCDDDSLLNHLRGPGPHMRGCFAVDAILGRR